MDQRNGRGTVSLIKGMRQCPTDVVFFGFILECTWPPELDEDGMHEGSTHKPGCVYSSWSCTSFDSKWSGQNLIKKSTYPAASIFTRACHVTVSMLVACTSLSEIYFCLLGYRRPVNVGRHCMHERHTDLIPSMYSISCMA